MEHTLVKSILLVAANALAPPTKVGRPRTDHGLLVDTFILVLRLASSLSAARRRPAFVLCAGTGVQIDESTMCAGARWMQVVGDAAARVVVFDVVGGSPTSNAISSAMRRIGESENSSTTLMSSDAQSGDGVSIVRHLACLRDKGVVVVCSASGSLGRGLTTLCVQCHYLVLNENAVLRTIEHDTPLRHNNIPFNVAAPSLLVDATRAVEMGIAAETSCDPAVRVIEFASWLVAQPEQGMRRMVQLMDARDA